MDAVLKVEECACCEQCTDILYEDDMGPYTFVCKFKNRHFCKLKMEKINKIFVYCDLDGPFNRFYDIHGKEYLFKKLEEENKQ